MGPICVLVLRISARTSRVSARTANHSYNGALELWRTKLRKKLQFRLSRLAAPSSRRMKPAIVCYHALFYSLLIPYFNSRHRLMKSFPIHIIDIGSIPKERNSKMTLKKSESSKKFLYWCVLPCNLGSGSFLEDSQLSLTAKIWSLSFNFIHWIWTSDSSSVCVCLIQRTNGNRWIIKLSRGRPRKVFSAIFYFQNAWLDLQN